MDPESLSHAIQNSLKVSEVEAHEAERLARTAEHYRSLQQLVASYMDQHETQSSRLATGRHRGRRHNYLADPVEIHERTASKVMLGEDFETGYTRLAVLRAVEVYKAGHTVEGALRERHGRSYMYTDFRPLGLSHLQIDFYVQVGEEERPIHTSRCGVNERALAAAPYDFDASLIQGDMHDFESSLQWLLSASMQQDS